MAQNGLVRAVSACEAFSVEAVLYLPLFLPSSLSLSYLLVSSLPKERGGSPLSGLGLSIE